MSLQIRRGTNAERLTITPQVGELIYVTDHTSENVAPLWVGDGLTVGGKSAITEVDVGSINDLDDVNVVGATDGQVLGYDAIQDIWNPIDIGVAGSGIIEGSNYRINIAADDSTIMVDTRTNEFNGTLNGTLNGDILGNVLDENNQPIVNFATRELFGRLTGFVEGNLDGDIRGSVFADDSTILLDGINNSLENINQISSRQIINSQKITTNSIDITSSGGFITSTNQITLTSLNIVDDYKVKIESPNRSKVLISKTDTSDLSSFAGPYGSVDFTRVDSVNGSVSTSRISGGNEFIYLIADSTGSLSNQADFLMWRNQKLGIGTSSPADTLDVRGSATISDTLTLAPLNSAPATPTTGMIAIDDGTDWSGVSGGIESVVAFVNGSWVKLG